VSTFWVYLRFQAMMFVFGIVGPIFLIIYFAVQPDPTLKWMYYFGLVATAADILIALALTANAVESRHELPQAKRTRKILGNGRTSRL
jgi:hypothetical protein